MKAIQIKEFGGADAFEYVDLPDPTPGEGEAVVEVVRSGVNFADTHSTRNDYLAEQQLPLIPGAEVAGRTADGRRVVALTGNGGYAQRVAVPESNLIPVPDGVGDDEAAPLASRPARRSSSRPPPAAPARWPSRSPSRPAPR
jgi:NADPH2:quinone reductase